MHDKHYNHGSTLLLTRAARFLVGKANQHLTDAHDLKKNGVVLILWYRLVQAKKKKKRQP